MSKTLVAIKNIAPYIAGDVFTVTDEQWAGIEAETPDKERDQKLDPLFRTCVVEYNPKKEEHVALLVAQRGKPVDADTEATPVAETDARIAELEAQLEAEKANRQAAEDAAAKAEDAAAKADAARVEAEKANKKP